MSTTIYFQTKRGILHHGDCLEVLSTIQERNIDMILCDLPYGTTACPWDKRIPLAALWAQYERIAKENAAIVLTAQQPFATMLINSRPKWFRYELIWHKPMALGFLNAKRMPLKAHENILIFYRKLPTYNPQMTEGVPYKKHLTPSKTMIYRNIIHTACENNGTRYPRSVLTFPRGKTAGHPTEKPLELFRWLIRTYTNPNDRVLDNCLGGGTTAAAAELENRRWIGIEQEEKYCEMSRKRLEALMIEGDGF